MVIILVADYEIFKKDSLLGVLDIDTNEIHQMWGVEEIRTFIRDHLEDIWIGFNSDNYDKILAHGMLTGKITTPEKAFEVSNAIIKTQDDDSPLYQTLAKLGMDDYYQSEILMYDLLGDGAFFSLKQLEGFLGMDIVESVVPFDLDRALTAEEKADIEKYNRADLFGTLERFKQRKNAFKTKMLLVKEFGLPKNYICKTNAKLTEAILLSQNKGVNTRLKHRFQLCDLPVNWEIPELKQIYEFFCEALKELEIHKWDTKKCDKKKLSMDLEILGVMHTFALGGVHGGIKHYICRPEDGKKIIWVDVSSLYPNILVQWDLLSRQIDKRGVEAFGNMVKVRMDIKAKMHDEGLSKEEKKTLKDQAARYKLILNTTSGCMKDKFKKIYDPEYNTKMCLLGQLALTDLIFRIQNNINEKLKKKPSWALPSEGSLDEVASAPREYFRLIQLTQWLK